MVFKTRWQSHRQRQGGKATDLQGGKATDRDKVAKPPTYKVAKPPTGTILTSTSLVPICHPIRVVLN